VTVFGSSISGSAGSNIRKPLPLVCKSQLVGTSALMTRLIKNMSDQVAGSSPLPDLSRMFGKMDGAPESRCRYLHSNHQQSPYRVRFVTTCLSCTHSAECPRQQLTRLSLSANKPPHRRNGPTSSKDNKIHAARFASHV
jgi:hypothetical protein